MFLTQYLCPFICWPLTIHLTLFFAPFLYSSFYHPQKLPKLVHTEMTCIQNFHAVPSDWNAFLCALAWLTPIYPPKIQMKSQPFLKTFPLMHLLAGRATFLFCTFQYPCYHCICHVELLLLVTRSVYSPGR